MWKFLAISWPLRVDSDQLVLRFDRGFQISYPYSIFGINNKNIPFYRSKIIKFSLFNSFFRTIIEFAVLCSCYPFLSQLDTSSLTSIIPFWCTSVQPLTIIVLFKQCKHGLSTTANCNPLSPPGWYLISASIIGRPT